MAKIADVLQTERNRQAPTEWNKIHIFQMGDFYRAYEWSAWLIVAITYNDRVRKETKDRKPLKESKKSLATTGEEFCFVGFPIKSVEKFIPTRLNFESVEDKHIVITIELPTPSDGSKVTYERLHEAFSKWKAGIPLSTKEDTIDENGNKRPPKPKPGTHDSQNTIARPARRRESTAHNGLLPRHPLPYRQPTHRHRPRADE